MPPGRGAAAARLRAEGMYDYDEHCHEDDAWKNSYGAQTHKAAVQTHEANLRAGYNAHSAYDVTNRGTNAAYSQSTAQRNTTSQYPAAPGTQANRSQSRNTPNLAVLKFLIPLGIILTIILLNILFSAIDSLSPGYYFP